MALYAKYQTESKSCGILASSTVVIKGTEDLGGRIVRALLESRKLIETLSNGLGRAYFHPVEELTALHCLTCDILSRECQLRPRCRQ